MAQIKADEITQLLLRSDRELRLQGPGRRSRQSTSLGDGIARIYGLDKVMAGELLSFPHGIAGLALSLEEDQVGSSFSATTPSFSKEGEEVKRTAYPSPSPLVRP